MENNILNGLFSKPYEHTRWLSNQKMLIERLNATKDEYLKQQAKILESFQKANQCSIVMVEIMRDRLEKHWKTSEK